MFMKIKNKILQNITRNRKLNWQKLANIKNLKKLNIYEDGKEH